MFNIFKKREDDSQKPHSQIGSFNLKPIGSLNFEGTKYSLYYAGDETPFYFITANDSIILYAFVILPYTSTESGNKIILYSDRGFVEIKFIFSINSANDIKTQTAFLLSNYSDLIKLYEEYNFKELIKDTKIASLVLSQSPYDAINGIKKLSVENFRIKEQQNSSYKGVVNVEKTTQKEEDKVKLESTEIERMKPEEIVSKVSMSDESYEMKADPHYHIGYLLDIDENYPNKTKFVINPHTKKPMKVFISNRSKDLIALNQHMLVAGVTGSGKTTFINNLTNILLYHGVNIISLDIKIGTLDTPINIISEGQSKKDLLDFMNDRVYKGDDNVSFTQSDLLDESLITAKDMTNRIGKKVIPLMLYYRANDKNEAENMNMFSKINILDLPELKTLKTLRKKLNYWKERIAKGEQINDPKYSTFEELQKDYNNKLLLYKNEITTLVGLYIETLAEIQTTIVKNSEINRYIQKMIDNGVDKIISYLESFDFEFLPSNNEFKKIVFDIDAIKSSDKDLDENSPASIFMKRITEAHNASNVVDLKNGIRLFDILQSINNSGTNFYLIVRTTPSFAMFYLLYSYYSVISLLASSSLKSIDPEDKNSPLVTFIIDEGTQLFSVNSDITEKYVKILKEGQQQTRGIRLSWIYGVQQPFKESFGIQTSLGGRVVFRAQPADVNAVKGLLASISNPELFDVVMKQDLAFITNVPIFVDEYNNLIQESVIKELPNRAPQVKPDGPINTHNYLDYCKEYLIDSYKLPEYELNLTDININEYLNRNGTLIKPVDNEIRNLVNAIIQTYNENALIEIKNDKRLSKSTLMNLFKTLVLFSAIAPDLSKTIDDIKNEISDYNPSRNTKLIAEITELFNEINTKINYM